MNPSKLLQLSALCGALWLSTPSQSQTWTPLSHAPGFAPSTALLLTDGTVMVQATDSGSWWKLTPDLTGSYINGTWSQLASMPTGYGPLYYASAVLPDGRVIVEGGEYNFPSPSPSGGGTQPLPSAHQSSISPSSTNDVNLGAIYDPRANVWTSVAPPTGWAVIADAAGMVLPNGTFMLNGFEYGQVALLNASALTWSVITPAGKRDNSDEEGWTLLPNGTLLTVDAFTASSSEIYTPASTSWSTVAMPDNLANLSPCFEVGPAVLRPQGNVFATGATSNTAVFNTALGNWTAGPTFPSGLGIVDGPAAILPDGNVLVMAAPTSTTAASCSYNTGSQFFEFNGSTLTAVASPTNAATDPSFVGRMLVLPTGQIFYTDGNIAEIYTSSGTYQAAWQPVISAAPATIVVGGANNFISGTQFNGLSQGATYGDDVQMSTNYPLVRITNNSTGHVFYARTHSHSTMGVATGSAPVSTQFDVPANIELGPSTLVVVANGIPSSPVNMSVTAHNPATLLTPILTILLGDCSAGESGCTP
jgi:hypothetical protein